MKLSAQPGIVEVESSPLVYLTLRPLASAGKRCLSVQTLFIQRQVLFANHLILPTQIIKELQIPLLATQQGLSCRLSRLPLGNNSCLHCSNFVNIYTDLFAFPLSTELASQVRRPK